MTFSERFPTCIRLGRFLWKCFMRVLFALARLIRKWFKRVVFAVACLITLAALVITEENYRTQRAWDNYQREAAARGVKLTLAELVPPPVPDDQNFAMTPLLKPLFSGKDYQRALGERLSLEHFNGIPMPGIGDWEYGKRTDLAAWAVYMGQPDVLTGMKKYEADMAEISAASRRPYSRFPIPYDKQPPSSIQILTIGPMLELSRLFELRGVAELAAGQTDRALDDAVTILHLSQTLKSEPVLISGLWSMAMLHNGLQVVWEGLDSHRWTDGQLAILQDEIQKIDLLEGMVRAMQGERAFFNDELKWIMARGLRSALRKPSPDGALEEQDSAGRAAIIFPRCFLLGSLVTCNKYYDGYFLPVLDVDKRRVYPQVAKAGAAQFNLIAPQSAFPLLHPSTFLLSFIPSFEGIFTRCAYTQTFMDEAAVACALERYRLAHGEYPEKLDDLAPQFMAKLPHDVISGGPLHYQRAPDGRFVLYGVGWNETDDHGTVEQNKGGYWGLKQDDWVWPSPSKP